MTPRPAGFAAIDFGTSNSAVALPAGAEGARLVEVEAGNSTMPTAVFYRADGALAEPERVYGRAAIAAYVDGVEGRLMRSMKSILGSNLAEQRTEIGGGRSVPYLDVVAGYLRHLKQRAEADAGHETSRLVLGRPVFFVDGEPERDRRAQAALEAAARAVGFAEVVFQYEPIAAALDHERRVEREQIVLVADIGGGTSDFSLVRVGPSRRGRADRRDDILASHGLHVAGTDFDRQIELEAILPLLGFRSLGPAAKGQLPREVPSRIYFDLATWHLINTVYTPARVAELRSIRSWYADPLQHRRLMQVLEARLGHGLAAEAEAAKIAVTGAGRAHIDLDAVESGLGAELGREQAAAAIDADLERIAQAARETLRGAGIAPERVEALYFTGGSTGLASLVERIGAAFPAAARVRGERFASVAQGLGLHARAVFGG
ncbi:MAG: Hsp70 family protein [Burkholderiales bacterium]|nr:Hsp70 family protein [Burkholderiales bacterium]MDE2397450.1 Hsp70 family protein [Burkholderiales bacterium]MDE2452079.1 Hsp70 family protein [Burkholderiales bacterium]